MPEPQKKPTPAKKTGKAAKKKGALFDLAKLTEEVELQFDPKAAEAKKKKESQIKSRKATSVLNSGDLNPIDPIIPFNRNFLRIGSGNGESSESGKLLGKFGANVKGIFSNFRGKEMEREEIVKLRQRVGDLKQTKADTYAPSPGAAPILEAGKDARSKKQILSDRRKKISDKSKEPVKDKELIGLRIEIERLKKRFPTDGNLFVLDAILTSRDGCLVHRTIEERVASLSAALKEAGSIVANQYLTTYSVDVIFDIYFLYLDSLKKLLAERLQKLAGAKARKNPTLVESTRRDIRIINVLADQKKLKKSIFNIAQKLNGFGYPYVSMTPGFVSKTFSSEARDENEKVGPGTIKLNKFLIRNYLNVFGQVPIFQPVARRFCDALPDDLQSKVIVANVNMDNAYTQLKLSKASKDPSIPKQVFSLFNYGKQFIKSTIKDAAGSPAEARIMLRTAEMAEEFSFLKEDADTEIIKFGHHCAVASLSFYKNEAESIIRRLFELADVKNVDLRESET